MITVVFLMFFYTIPDMDFYASVEKNAAESYDVSRYIVRQSGSPAIIQAII